MLISWLRLRSMSNANANETSTKLVSDTITSLTTMPAERATLQNSVSVGENLIGGKSKAISLDVGNHLQWPDSGAVFGALVANDQRQGWYQNE